MKSIRVLEAVEKCVLGLENKKTRRLEGRGGFPSGNIPRPSDCVEAGTGAKILFTKPLPWHGSLLRIFFSFIWAVLAGNNVGDRQATLTFAPFPRKCQCQWNGVRAAGRSIAWGKTGAGCRPPPPPLRDRDLLPGSRGSHAGTAAKVIESEFHYVFVVVIWGYSLVKYLFQLLSGFHLSSKLTMGFRAVTFTS